MGDDYEEVGNHFVTHYFTTFDNDRSELAPLYNENSVCTYEGEQMKGQEQIMTYLTEKLSFRQVAHEGTTIDCQPVYDGGVFITVMGQLKPDDDPVLPFVQSFMLQQDGEGSWFILHEVFRIVVHNG
eukprot:m.434794 g.434794  ORF g.434794 m.434794 type:complete len:127 (-) comp17769_c0_seq1:246-626(-)